MKDIFFSYTQIDRERVRPIVDALKEKGLTVWWDPEGAAGLILDEMVKRELDSAKCVIVAWSNASVKSDWVIGEADEARKRRILVPIAIDDTTPPYRFRRFNTVFLKSTSNLQYSAEFHRILSGIQYLVRNTKPIGPPKDVTFWTKVLKNASHMNAVLRLRKKKWVVAFLVLTIVIIGLQIIPPPVENGINGPSTPGPYLEEPTFKDG